MKLCIICKTPKTENSFGDEHIVPEFMGGGLSFREVCNECNSKMGGSFEGRLSNIFLFKAPRFIHNIGGKQSKAPNPFSGTFEIAGGNKIQIDDRGKMRILPLIKAIRAENDSLNVRFVVDERDFHLSQNMVKKRLARHFKAIGKKHDVKEVNDSFERSIGTRKLQYKDITNPIIKIEESFSLNDLMLLHIKIAYEIACFNYGIEYIEDVVADFLRQSLTTQSPSNEIRGQLFLPKESDILNGRLAEGYHWVILINNFCYIRLYDHLTTVVCFASDGWPNLKLGRAFRFCYKTQAYECFDLSNFYAKHVKLNKVVN